MISKGQLGTEKEAVERRILAFVIDSGIIIWVLLVILRIGDKYMYMPMPPFARFSDLSLFITHIVNISTGWFLDLPFSLSSFLENPLTIWFVYAFVLEGWKGQTIGKKLLSLVVVGKDGNPCGFRCSFIRNVLRYIDGLGYYILGLIVMLLSERRQRIGDHVARTFVVKAK
jgi:uncharacterized RDD family membrane protein YckC